jgi:uncharacterized protein (TIGR02646 family)
MRKIDRNSVPPPTCLAEPKNGLRYHQLCGLDKAEIRHLLLELQKERCAYCERRTGREKDDGHIEHFRNQAEHEHLDVEWTNMFWSCQDEKTCGKHKDKCNLVSGTGPQRAFDVNELIDPCVDDPDEFLLLVSDGTVRPRPGLSASQERRASETLRVFQLADSAYLRKARADAVHPYVSTIDQLLPFGVDIVKAYVQHMMATIQAAAFSTAVKHYLGGLLN